MNDIKINPNSKLGQPSRIAFNIELEDNWRQTVCCPSCGGNYNHFNADCIDVTKGGDDYEAHPSVRGSVITVPMACELCHCYFEMFIGFHKGSTYMWNEIPNTKADRDDFSQCR